MRKGEIACYNTALYLLCVKMGHCVVMGWAKTELMLSTSLTSTAAYFGAEIAEGKLKNGGGRGVGGVVVWTNRCDNLIGHCFISLNSQIILDGQKTLL